MDNQIKFCPKCGKKIPAAAEFCPFCGAKQPAVSGLDHRQGSRPAQKSEPSQSRERSSNDAVLAKDTPTEWFKKPWGIVIIVAVVLVVLVGATKIFRYNHPNTDSIASSIQSTIREDDDFGSATVHYSESTQTFDIDIPESSTAMTNLDNGYPSIWNSLVKELKEKSQSLDNDYTSGYSYIQVMSPYNSNRTYLQVNHGIVKYNIADDLN